MNCNPTDVTEKVSALTWPLPETPGINLCRDINGLFLLGWALRVTARGDKAQRNRLWGEGEKGGGREGKTPGMLKSREGAK